MSNKTQIEKRGDREIFSERVFDAPRERVWAAYTEPELLAQWWGPRKYETVIDVMDFRPGGSWRILNQGCGGEHGFRGTYREISEPERIVQTWEWEGMPGHVLIETAELEDLGDDRTKVTVTSLFHTTEERDGMFDSGMETGAVESYERLDELLAAQG